MKKQTAIAPRISDVNGLRNTQTHDFALLIGGTITKLVVSEG